MGWGRCSPASRLRAARQADGTSAVRAAEYIRERIVSSWAREVDCGHEGWKDSSVQHSMWSGRARPTVRWRAVGRIQGDDRYAVSQRQYTTWADRHPWTTWAVSADSTTQCGRRDQK